MEIDQRPAGVDRSTGVSFINYRIPSALQIEATLQCDAFDNARSQAESSPGTEIQCGNCPLLVEFDSDSHLVFIDGICDKSPL